jgi:hemerythrin-like domain-containing protein
MAGGSRSGNFGIRIPNYAEGNRMSQVSLALHDEHRSSLDLLGRVEQAFARAPRPTDARDAARLAGAFARLLEADVGRHFDFEEQKLFPRLAEAGEGDIADLLTEEHAAIREVAALLLPLAQAAAAGTLDDAGFAAFRRGLPELIERQVSHIQKETMALLPMLDDLLDPEADRELAMEYAAG